MGEPARWKFQEDALDNGLRVLTLEDHRSPIASVHVWYHVGSKDEDPQRQGFAHMFEHMMFRGTDKIGPQDHFKFLQRYGANVNGYTSFDMTVYHETLPASQLDLALWLEADRMANLKINQDYFAAEREVVKEERRMRYLNRPYGRVYETLFGAAFTEHPYRWTPIGNMPHLNAATVEELVAFWKRYYVPNNATLVVVGDVRREDVVAKARQYFGNIPRKADPPRVSIREPAMAEPRRVEIQDIAPAPRIVLAYPAPSARDKSSLALDVLSKILSAGQSSPLYRNLVQGKAMAVNVSASNYSLEQAALFTLSMTLKPGVDIAAGEQALLDELKLILDNGIVPEDMEKARNQALAEYVHGGETVHGRANQLGYAAVILGDANRVNTDLDDTRRLTAEDILNAAKRTFDENQRTTIIVRPEEKPSQAEEPDEDKSKAAEPLTELRKPGDLPSGQSPQPIDLPFAQRRKLRNGLEVAVFSDHAQPAVSMSFNVLGGARNDPADKPGVAYVTASVLRRGTTRHSGDELAHILDHHAISLWQDVDHEAVRIRTWTLSEYLDLAAGTLAEIVREPAFPEKEVANFTTRAAAQEAINEKDPSTVASRSIAQTLFGDHYRGRPDSGTSTSLKTISRDDLTAFHRQSFAPDRVTLLFAGDITADRAFALAEKHFADWSGKAEATAPAAPPPRVDTQIRLLHRPGAVQSEIRIGQLVPMGRMDADYPAARLLGQIFGGSFSGRLNRSLRIEKGLTYGARGYFDVNADVASFQIGTFTRTEKTADAVRAAVDEVRRLIEPNVTAEELETARDSLLGMFQMGLEMPAQVAERYWDLIAWRLPETWYSGYLKALSRVSEPDALYTAARRVLDPDRLTIVVVGDADKIEAPLRAIAPVARIAE